jgi:hypothetical protein
VRLLHRRQHHEPRSCCSHGRMCNIPSPQASPCFSMMQRSTMHVNSVQHEPRYNQYRFRASVCILKVRLRAVGQAPPYLAPQP